MGKISRLSRVFNTLTLFSFLYAIKLSTCMDSKYEGESCQKLGLPGICKKARDCAIAMDQIRETSRHDLLRCGFIGSEEVVCCPDLTFRNPKIETTTIDSLKIWTDGNRIDTKKDKNPSTATKKPKTKRISQKMCEKIYKDNNIRPKITYNILNGEDAEIGQFPHMAAIGFKTEFNEINWGKCGASLIDSRFLLTAAHCFICPGCKNEDAVKIRVGVIDISLNESAQDRAIKNVSVHQNYSISSRLNDIALIELFEDVEMSKTIYPACLRTTSDDPSGLVVTGWGLTDPNNQNSRSKILQIAKVEAIPVISCNVTLLTRQPNTEKIILDSQICAIANGTDPSTRQDACQGDSGAPLQIESREGGYEIVGVVSYGEGCGSSLPGIYTRVSAFLDWIEEQVWSTEQG